MEELRARCLCSATPGILALPQTLALEEGRRLSQAALLRQTLRRTLCFLLSTSCLILLLLAARPGMAPFPVLFRRATGDNFVSSDEAASFSGDETSPLLESQTNALPTALAATASAAAALASRAVTVFRSLDSDAVQVYTARLLGAEQRSVDVLLFLGGCFLCAGGFPGVETKRASRPGAAAAAESFPGTAFSVCAAQFVWISAGAWGVAELAAALLRPRVSPQVRKRRLVEEMGRVRTRIRQLEVRPFRPPRRQRILSAAEGPVDSQGRKLWRGSCSAGHVSGRRFTAKTKRA